MSSEPIRASNKTSAALQPLLAAMQMFEQEWQSHFASSVLHRGGEYAAQGRATMKGITVSTARRVEVQGMVQGTKGYSVALFFSMPNQLIDLETSCSCPYLDECKHAAALLTKFFSGAWRKDILAAGGLQMELDARISAPVEVKTNSMTGKNRETQQLPLSREYERALTDIAQQAKALPPHKMVPRSEIGYRITLDGNWQVGKLARFTIHPIAITACPGGYRAVWGDDDQFRRIVVAGGVRPSEEDAVLLVALGAVTPVSDPSRFHEYRRDIFSVQGDKVLKAVGTGRCFLGAAESPVTLGPEVEVDFGWTLTVAGNRVPVVLNLPENSGILNCEDPPLYFDPKLKVVGSLKSAHPSITPKQWLSLSLAKPKYTQALLAGLRARKLPVAGLEDVDGQASSFTEVLPKVHVVVRETGKDLPCGLSYIDSPIEAEDTLILRVSSDPDPLLCAEIHFNYEGTNVASETPNTPLVDPSDPAKRIFRSMEFEKGVRRELVSLGLVPLSSIPGAHGIAARGLLGVAGYNSDMHLQAWLRIAPHLRDLAGRRGWEVTLPAALNLPTVTSDEWFGSVSEGVATDKDPSPWFDGDLGIIVGGEQRSLTPILLTLLKKGDRILTPIRYSGSKNVALRIGGEVLTLARERLLKILTTLSELVENSTKSGTISLSRMAAYELQRSLGDEVGRWDTAASIQALRDRIRNLATPAIVKQPLHFGGELRDYQRDGVSWLSALASAELGGLLADDMGLGKTIQLIAFMLHERAQGRTESCLVVCPKSVVPNWAAELHRFAPSLVVHRNVVTSRMKNCDAVAHNDVVITTYQLLMKDQKIFKGIKFNIAIFDEAQHIKNSTTMSYYAATRIQARMKIPVSGTPVENNLGDLWTHFNLTMPGFLSTREAFKKLYRVPIEKYGDTLQRERLSGRIKPFVMRRTKEEVVTELPPITEIVHRCELEGDQRDLYETIRQLTDKRVRDALREKGAKRSHIEFLDALLKLRQVCCDPRLVKSSAAKKVKHSAKCTALFELISTLLDDGRRILIFSQFTSMLALIEEEVKARKLSYVILTGETSDRDTPVMAFQGGEVPIFLVSLKAGGVGLNLTRADAVILYDPWWNPAVEDQAISRAHRIGQMNPVFVYRLIAEGTIEEKILDLQAKKKALVATLLPENETPPQLNDELIDLLFAPIGSGEAGE